MNDSINLSWNGATEEGVSYTGNKYAFTDAQNPYGLGFKKKVDASFKDKNIRLIVEGWIKADAPESSGTIAIQVKNGDSSLYWNTVNLNDKKLGKDWTFFSDTFNIARSLMTELNEISTFMWNTDGKGKVRGDDFFIKITEWEMPSFVPEVNTEEKQDFTEQLFKGNFYSILYNEKNGSLAIADKQGIPISKAIIHYEETRGEDGKINKEEIQKFSITKTNDSSIVLKASSKSFETTYTLHCNTNKPELKTDIVFRAVSQASVQRQSMIIPYLEEMDQVYRSNTLIDTSNFQEEYWLNTGGCKIGNKEKSLVVCGNTHLSSCQVNVIKKLLVFNFDYTLDHPLMQFPLRNDDKKGVKKDISANNYATNETHNSTLKLFIGSEIETMPVLMQQPDGYLSAFIFTEHADYTDLPTSYAVYNGSSAIKSCGKATGGFCKYGIPVTKSIFYHNPEQFNNKEFNGVFTSEMLAWKGNPEYQKFIRELYSRGNEICLHTPDYATSTRAYMEEALSFFAKEFKSTTWIDHGYDNGKGDNREDFVCDGLIKGSENYSLDLWEKYGVKYFWNCYNEDSAIYGQRNFSNRLKNPYFGFGDVFPAPEYWHNKASGNQVISWKSDIMMDFKDDNNWNYYFDNTVLGDMVQNRQTVISHSYPARVDSVTSFYVKNDDGTFSVNEKFDSFLQRLSALRDKKQVNITTIKKYLDYQLMLRNIDITVEADGSISIANFNFEEIKGLTIFSLRKFRNNENMAWSPAPNGGYLYTMNLPPSKKISIKYP